MIAFQTAFETVKERTGDNPERLWLAKEDAALKIAISDLDRLIGRLENGMPHLTHRYAVQISRSFQETLRDYDSRYKDRIRILGHEFGDELLTALFEVPKEPSPQISTKPSNWAPDEFDSEFDNAGFCLQELFDHLESRSLWLEDGVPKDPDWEDLANVAAGAWCYLGAQGIDPMTIAERLKKVPFIKIPTDVSDAHSLSAKVSLYDLLEDAVQAYVCGAPLAALAMCRATGELVLKRNYGLTFNEERPGLKTVVRAVEKEYPCLKRLNLYDAYERVNEILHSADRSNVSASDEVFVLEMFHKTQKVIEEAPVAG